MRHYPAKLLLFGEYILLLGARALAVPVHTFQGYWTNRIEGSQAYPSLAAFASSKEVGRVAGLDQQQFQQDVEAGWYFKSDIPTGYGLGSSGALCAGVYDRFVGIKSTDRAELKNIFAGMESFFHGQSSGIDPLTSYLDRPIWVSNQQSIQFFEPPTWASGAPLIFLLDTGLPRQTGPLVQWFLEKSGQAAYRQRLESEYLNAHEALLQAWATGRLEEFWNSLYQVSSFQLNWMQPMVPDQFRDLWLSGLSSNQVLFKICGAGGGGFLLGFAKSKSAVMEQLNAYKLFFPFENHGLVEK